MSTLRTKTLVLAVLIIASAAVVYIQERANEELRAQLNGLRQENEHAGVMLAAKNKKTDATVAWNKKLAEFEAHSNADFSLSKDYERMALRLREQLPDNYAALFRSLKLGPDQQALFEKLLIEKQATETVIAHDLSFGQYPGLAPDNLGALKSLLVVGTEDIDSQIQQILGSALYDQYKHYNDTLNSRRQVNAFAAQLKYTGVPLRDTQVDQLVELLAKTGSDPTAPLPGSFETQAAAILDPAQAPALKTLTAVLQAHRTILAANRAALANGKLRLTTPTGATLRRNLDQ